MELSEFLDSVVRGDVPAVAAALDAHPEWADATDQNQRTWRAGWNALAVAALSGQAEVVQLLLARGAHAGAVTGGISLIAIAAVEGRRAVVDVLVQAGLPVDLFAAAAIGDAQRVTALLRDNPALVHECTYDGKTALHFCRSTEVAEVLLAAGAPIDGEDDSGQTPLQWISATGRYKGVCRYLIAHGAAADATDIFWACSYGDVAAVLRFLEIDGALVNARRPAGARTHASWIGRTPLHEAAIRGETAVGRLLIARGADVNAPAGDNVTPLHLAACAGHREIAELLMAASANPDVRDLTHDATPGEWARFWGHPDLASYLESLRP
jgi:ankyrin repeat protein